LDLKNKKVVSLLIEKNGGKPNKKYHETETKLSNQLLLRPESCGGYLIEPYIK
jgi:hypothetical protein